MKRNRAGHRSGAFVDINEGEQGHWSSFADMMSSFALILFFLMLIAYLQNLITGNELVSTQDRLAETEETLRLTAIQVEEAKETLQGLSVELDDAEAALLLQQEEMALYAATIQGQTATIEEQKGTIEAQKEYINLTTEELTRLRSQMQTIAFLRLSILEKISDSIGSTLGDASKVRIADNGSIILSEGLLFDFSSAKIKTESYPMLNELTKAFVSFLSDPENAAYVDSIVISGHTDNIGSAAKNRSLAAERANAVLDYLLEQNSGILQPYESYFCGAGYGATRPVADNSTAAGRDQNRRIEISIILKDETVLEIVDAYLAQEMPAFSPAPTATPRPSLTPGATPTMAG